MQTATNQQAISQYHRPPVHPPQTTERAMEIIRGRTPLLTPELHAAIVEGFREGKTYAEVAKAIGVGVSTLFQWKSTIPDFIESIAQAREDWSHAIVDRGLTGLIESDDTSMIAVRKAENIGKLALDIAGRLNPDYSPKSQQKNLNINVAVDKPVDLDMFRR